MKSLQRLTRMGVVVAALVFAGAVQAQQLNQVPSEALFIVKMKNLQGVSAKLGNFAKQLGVAAMVPESQDPLAMLEKQAGITQGLRRDGDLIFAYLDSDLAGGDPDQAMVILLPVTDYQAFLGNFAEKEDAEAGVTRVTFPDAADPVYAANWGEFAAISPSSAIVARKPGGLVVQGIAARELDTRDITFYANMELVRAKLLPKLEEGRQEMLEKMEAELDQGDEDQKKFAPVAKVLANQALNVLGGFLRDASAATYSITFTDAGIQVTTLADFIPDSYAGRMTSRVKSTDAALLAGLPEGKYLAFGGMTVDAELLIDLMDDFVGPIMLEVDKLDPEINTAVDEYYAAIKAALQASESQSFGLFAPSGQLGQDSIIKSVNILKGDAAALKQAQKSAMDTQEKFMALFSEGIPPTKTLVTENAKTIDGVAFDQFSTEFTVPEFGEDATEQQRNIAMQAMQTQQMMQMLFGPQGQVGLVGAVDEKTLIATMGVDDAVLAGVIAAARTGANPLAALDGVKAVSAQLPPQRVAVTYVAVDHLVASGLDYARAAGFDMPVQFPADLPPIGAAFATEGSAVRADYYVPAQLVQSLVTAGLQAFMIMQMQGDGAMMP